MSRDPIGEEGGINLYGLINNDGINKWDFLGLEGDFKSRTIGREIDGIRIDVELPSECPAKGQPGRANLQIHFKQKKYLWHNDTKVWRSKEGYRPPARLLKKIANNREISNNLRKGFRAVNCKGGFAPKFGGGKMLGTIGMLLVVYQTFEARAFVFQYHQALQDHRWYDAKVLRQKIAMNLPDTGSMKQTELLLLLEDTEKEYRQQLVDDDCCCEE